MPAFIGIEADLTNKMAFSAPFQRLFSAFSVLSQRFFSLFAAVVRRLAASCHHAV